MAVEAVHAIDNRSGRQLTKRDELRELLELHPEAVTFKRQTIVKPDLGSYTGATLPAGMTLTVLLPGELQAYCAVWRSGDALRVI